MSRQKNKENSYLLVWVACIYVVCVAVAVGYAWSIGDHLYDMSLTVSLYVALYPWTAVLYFLGAAAVCLLLGRYVWKTDIRLARKVLYYLILLCVFGCAVFPCNRSRSVLIADIHDIFSYVLVILVAVSFGVMAVFSRNRRQKIFAICSTVYSVLFIAGFAMKLPVVKEAVFLWENGVIVLLFFGLVLERPRLSRMTQRKASV